MNFNPDTLKSAQSSLKRIDKLVDGLKAVATKGSSTGEGGGSGGVDEELVTSLTAALRSFEEAMCDDMNTPR